MIQRLSVLLIAPLLALVVAGMPKPAAAAEFSSTQRSEIETIAREYLVAHPEVIRDAILELQQREKVEEAATRAKTLQDSASLLFRPGNGGVIGNPNGKVTLVEFFDYNCGYCKKSLSDVSRLVKDNPDLKIILKDFPVLGPGSVEAAQVEAAVRNQFTGDKFFDYHQRLLGARGHVGKAQALAPSQKARWLSLFVFKPMLIYCGGWHSRWGVCSPPLPYF